MPSQIQAFLLLSSCLLLSVSAAPCEKGFYNGADGKCTPCPAGTYNDVTGAQGIDVCLPCPGGTFSSKAAAISRTQCISCPKDSNSPPGATKCTTCPPGSFIRSSDNKCVNCNINEIAPDANSVECTTCYFEVNAVANMARTKCVKCPPGSQPAIQHPGRCVKCRIGSFNDGTYPQCQDCPPGTAGNVDRISGCEECPSGTANFHYRSMCRRCPKGQNVGAIGSTTCLEPGEECFNDDFKTRTGACKSCMGGERLDSKLKICVKCSKGTVSPGGSSTTCERCDKVSIPSEGGLQCECPTGWTYYPDGSCRECPAGRHVEDHLLTFDDHDKSKSCNECPDGTFSTGGVEGACKICPDGFEPNSGKTGCQPCAAGLRTYVFSDLYSTSRCVDPKTNCPPGEDRVSVGNDNRLFECGPKICPKSTDEDHPVGQKKCLSCPIGSFLRTPSDGDSFESTAYCVRCPKGLGLPGCSGCEKCPGNQSLLTLPNQLGSICGCRTNMFFSSFLSRGTCVNSCPDGQRGVLGDSFSTDRCEECPLGTARRSSDISFDCQECPKGFFAGKAGQAACQKCPDGETTVSKGSTSCVSL